MESFYGGRQGASFVIKKSFKYIDFEDPAWKADNAAWEADPDNNEEPTEWHVMFRCLNDTTYHDVWYNEYCIIDTTNKNNPNNGKIFRRVLPTEGNDNLPYEYVGTIVGPSSAAAMLKPQSGLIKNFNDIRAELENEWDGLGIAENTKPVIYDPSFSSGSNQQLSQWPDNVELETYKVEIDKGLVHAINPKEENIVVKETIIDEEDGKTKVKTSYDSEKIVNDIKYNWFNVRKNTEGNDGVVESWCYIGFEIPAPSFTVEALYKTPGTKPEVYLTENAKDFAFWHDIHFDIPGGIRGISVEKIFTNDTYTKKKDEEGQDTPWDYIEPTSAWTFDQIEYDTLTDTYSIKGETISYNKDKESSITTDHQLPYETKSLFCNLRIINPRDNAEGEDWPVVLKNLTFFIGTIEEIENVDLNTETGHLEVSYHNEPADKWDLRYPKQITFKTATDQIQTGGEEKEITYNTGYYDIDYSCGDDESGQFGFVRKVTIAEDENGLNGSLTFTNSIEDQTQTYKFSYPKTLEFLTTDNLHDGRWKIDYFGAEDKSGQFGFVKSVGIAEDENGLNGTMTFNNTIEAETQEFDFSYPQDMSLNSDTGEWEIDYFGAEDKSGQLGYVKAAAIDSNKGTITFTNTIEDRTTVQDLIYVKDIDADAETGILTATYSNSTTEDFVQFDYPKSITINQSTGEYDIDYSKRDNVTGQFGFVDKATIDSDNGTLTFRNTATGNDVQTFVYPKTIQMDTEGNVTYINSASETIDMGQLVFVDDVVVDNAHQLLIAYTDNSQVETTANGTVELNGKTYINYGQTIGKLGITSGPIPTGVIDKATIDNIVAWYNATYAQGMIDGEVSGKLHVVTTEPIDGTDPISYFVMWDPDAKTWYQVSEIAGAPVGIPAQIGGVLKTGGSESWSYSDSENSLADGVVRFVQLTENEQSLNTIFPWQ